MRTDFTAVLVRVTKATARSHYDYRGFSSALELLCATCGAGASSLDTRKTLTESRTPTITKCGTSGRQHEEVTADTLSAALTDAENAAAEAEAVAPRNTSPLLCSTLPLGALETIECLGVERGPTQPPAVTGERYVLLRFMAPESTCTTSHSMNESQPRSEVDCLTGGSRRATHSQRAQMIE